MFIEPEVETLETEVFVRKHAQEEQMPVFLARPRLVGGVSHPALLLIQEAFGVNEHIRDMCCRFAKQGYVVLSPDLYYRSGAWQTFDYSDFEKARPLAQSLTEELVYADLHAVLDHLAAMPDVDAARIGVLGYCMGGRLSFYAAAVFPKQIKCAAIYYGGGIVADEPSKGWSNVPIGLAPNIEAPLIGFFGGQDAAIPAAHVERIDKALDGAGVEHEIYLYPEAGHGFNCDARPSFHPGASQDAWHRTLQCFDRHLGPVSAQHWPSA